MVSEELYMLTVLMLSMDIATAVTTTIGHSIKTLQNSTVFVTGSAVVFMVPPTNSSSGRNLFSSSVAQSTKGICAHVLVHKPCKVHNSVVVAASCVSICFSLSSGKFISQQELIPTTQTQCALARSTSLQGIGTYIPRCQLVPINAHLLSQRHAMMQRATVCGHYVTMEWMCGTVLAGAV